MINQLIDMIIITVGQWGQFGGTEYEQRFESLLCQLEKAIGLDREGAIAYLENAVEGESVT